MQKQTARTEFFAQINTTMTGKLDTKKQTFIFVILSIPSLFYFTVLGWNEKASLDNLHELIESSSIVTW